MCLSLISTFKDAEMNLNVRPSGERGGLGMFQTLCMCACVREVPVASPPSLQVSAWTTKCPLGGLFHHILITGDHPSRAEALSRRRVLTAAATDHWISHLNLFILSQVEDGQMKSNEEKYMLGEELALFTHHHRGWSLLPARAPSQLRDTPFEMHVCFPFESSLGHVIRQHVACLHV